MKKDYMWQTEPLISVIVPIYNVEEYVAECIESITRQTYQNIQVILVDDGSQDQSGIICEHYAALDERIEVVHQSNMGLVVARKSGLEKATGDYIGFVDGDDYIEADMYENLLREIQESDADFVHSGFIKNEDTKIPFKKKVIYLSNMEEKENIIRTAIFGSDSYITPSIWSKLFKSHIIKECYGQVPDSAQYGEDLINLCICIKKCDKVVLVEEAYYHYRYRGDSITNEKNIKGLENIFRYYGNICDTLVQYKSYEELKSLIMEDVIANILGKIRSLAKHDFQIAQYYFADSDKLRGKKVVIYGAGIVGKDYYAQISRHMDCSIIAWVDTYPEKYEYPHIKLFEAEKLNTIEYDILLIAVAKEEIAQEISVFLINQGVEEKKIFWSEPQLYKVL